ncbi:MAG TPA: hypothetical protein DCY93_02865 [Firmicutes bacterium]|nr:hypothetical protein [Bacillota bacterium]
MSNYDDELSAKKLRKRLIFGTFAILACFAMVLGIMYTIANASEKVRNIVIITFASILGAALVAFYLYAIISYFVKKKKYDPDYNLKKGQRKKNK